MNRERKFWVVENTNTLTPQVRQVTAEPFEDDYWYVHPHQIAGMFGKTSQSLLFESKKEALDHAVATWVQQRNNAEERIKYLRSLYDA